MTRSERDRARYLRQKAAWNERSMARNAIRRKELKEFITAYKLSHPCVDCGEADPVVLDFDHIGEKSFGIAHAYTRARSIKSVTAEIAQCEVRCANCHRRKTYERNIRWSLVSAHAGNGQG